MIAALILAFQVAVDAPLDNPRLEARAEGLMREIRCVVCENEPVSQSMADIAVDMRRVIREQVQQGASDGQVRKYFADRYGDHVLFRPPVSGLGLLAWIAPFVLLLGIGGWMGFRAFSHRKRDLAPLADEAADPRTPPA